MSTEYPDEKRDFSPKEDSSSLAEYPSPNKYAGTEPVHKRGWLSFGANRDQHLRVEDIDTSDVDEKALIRKIDWKLIPILSLLYLMSFLDRTAVGNAKLYGLEKSIGITDDQYRFCLTVFFFSYAIFEVPSNILLKRLRPSVWFTIIMLAWGGVMLAQGFVKNYTDLVLVRLFLGFTEAGLFPGVSYYLSCWYKRSEYGLRSAIFFSAATISGAFGGLLAAAIHNLDGVRGRPGWSWIFIIEGAATIGIAFLAYFILTDFPDEAQFLTPKERAFVVKRLQDDLQFSAAGEKFRWKSIVDSVTDWKTWVGMAMYMAVDGPLYAFALFLPTIIFQLGYTATKANLISVPIYVVASILSIGAGFAADRIQRRAIFNVIFFTIGGAGCLILIFSRSPGLSYFAVYLAAAGICPLVPNVITWVGSSVEGTYKRGATIALVISWGNLNGAVTSNVYLAKDKPWYTMGHGILLAYVGIGLISTAIMYVGLKRENARRDRGERDERIGGINPNDGKEWFATVEEAKMKKGDAWSGFRYTT